MIQKCILVLAIIGLATVSARADDELVRGFVNPPDSAKPWVYWWWLNGYVSKDGIRRDLDAMKQRGISGALVFHAGSGKTPEQTVFMSPRWREFFRFAVEEAAKRNITIGLNLCGGWNAGGPWVTEEDGVKVLVHATTNVRGPKPFAGLLPKSANADSTYRDVVVLAWPVGPDSQIQSKGLIDVTDKMDAQGRLKWDVPAGQWCVVRFGWQIPGAGHTKCTGGTRQLEIDPLDPKAIEKHFAATAGVVIKDVGPHVGKTFKYVHIDSGEIGHPDWTPRFREQFKRLRGYDPFPYLAAKAGHVVDSEQITERFLEDYQRTIGDLMIECYYGRLGELARPHGLGTHSEAAGYQKPTVDALRAMGCNDICMSEYWSRKFPGYAHQLAEIQLHYHDGIKNAASAAHVYGRPIVQAEAYTTIRGMNYGVAPFDLKDIGDRAFCAGLNRNVLHQHMCQADEQAKPGYVWPGIGMEFDRHSTWWPIGSAWLAYLARCQYLLQQGRFVGDVCYFQGDWVPAYVPAKWAMDPPLSPGFDCDTINTEALIRRASVDKGGRLVLPDGQSYRYLVLWQGGRWQLPPRSIFESKAADVEPPKTPETGSGKPLALAPATLRKLKELVEAGVTVIGPRPNRSVGLTDYPSSNDAVQSLADSLWGPEPGKVGRRTVGKGRVIWGQSLADVIREDGLRPDLEIRESRTTKSLPAETLSGIPSPGTFNWIHRKIDEADVYFIANLRNAPAAGLFLFRSEGKQPELWDAVTKETRDAAAFKQTDDGRTVMPLKLPPRGSTFVVFRRPIPASRGGSAKTNQPRLSPVVEIDGPWTVRFDPEWGGPESIVFEQLEDWSERPEPGIKYYSGTATYRKTFDLPEALRDGKKRVYLDLGRVNQLAAVRLNGKRLGIVWTAPRRVEITDAVRSTGNQLEIDVANLWNNRLVGDAALPPDERLTTTNVTRFTKDTPLLPSGLLGPVSLVTPSTPPKYADGRPAATLRMDAEDHGVVLRHGDGPDQCDLLGARDVWVYRSGGTYYMHYDAAGPKGWLCSSAVSKDLVNWEKKGPILDFGKPGEDDAKSASYGVTYRDGDRWHMFYLGTPNVSAPPNLIPSFPYLTMKAKATGPAGPWIKQKDVVPFRPKADTYYSMTASPGQIIKHGDEYLQFFSATTRKPGNPCVQRTLGIARTKNLDGPWTVDPQPMVPIEEQIENSSLYYEESNRTWFLFTNHIGIDGGEYTDAVWVYWTKDLNRWDPRNKAVVLDGKNCKWSTKCIGLPSVVRVGKRLALFYDAPGGNSISHMRRNIGLAWLDLPLSPPVNVQKKRRPISSEKSPSPNILLILVDDVGYCDVGAFAARVNQTTTERLYYETPRIDALAGQGTMFTQFYSCTVCAPTRASLMTGKMNNRMGMWDAYAAVRTTFEKTGKTVPEGCHILDNDPWNEYRYGKTDRGVSMPVAATALHDAKTIPQGLHGYHSAFIGKWHLGSHNHEGYRPEDQGFDETLAYFDGGGSGYHRPFRAYAAATPRWDKPGPALLPRQDYLSDDVAQRVNRFLEDRVSNHSGEPFFLYVAHPACHGPVQSRADDLDYFTKKAKTAGWIGHKNPAYAGLVKGMDRSIGAILDKLDELKLTDNTAVIFISDNGGHPVYTRNTPLRGGKSMLYEGGIRVPMIVRWPGKTIPGSVCDIPSDIADIYPTIMDMAGVDYSDFKADETTDGQSLLPLLSDLGNRSRGYTRDAFYQFYGKMGYKGFHNYATWATLRKGDFKLHYDYHGKVELYNIAEDMFEKNDLVAARPKMAHDMLVQLTEWLEANCNEAYLPKPNPNFDPTGALPYGPYVPLEELKASLLERSRENEH